MPTELPDRSGSLIKMALEGDETVLAPYSLSVREAISEPTEIEVSAMHLRDPFAPEEILQKAVTITLQRDGLTREFKGYVRGYTPLGADDRGYHSCTLQVASKLWALSQAVDCRIFQEKTAQEIVETLLDDTGLSEREFNITGDKPVLGYRTQYNESRLHFMTRILEEAGWFFFFDGDKVIVTDANASLGDLGALPAAGALAWSIRPKPSTAGGKEITTDYDPVNPSSDLKGEQATVLSATGVFSPESFRWPALTDQQADSARRSRLRMEAAEAAASLLAGETEWIQLEPGKMFEVTGEDTFLPPGKYGVRAVSHTASDESWLNNGSPPTYGNAVELFPEATPWRQPLTTPRPRMEGIHAAVVLGAEGAGDIHTDDLARVKVKFFWDHRSDASGDQAVWARVIMPWAGNGWGGQFIPRVGTEVAVAFMDGDPDRPVVLGGFYNGADAPIYSKDDKTKSGFRSRSADKGGTADFNEFTFQDKKGKEQIFIHAQKDFDIEVEHDLTLKVDNCRIVTVKVDETVTIKGKQSVTVKGDQTLKVEEGNRELTVMKGDYKQQVDTGNYKMGVKTGNYDENVDTGNYKMAVKTGNYDVDLQAGNVTIKTAGGAVTIEAAQSITLKVGGSSVEIGPSGITVKGPMLTLKGDAMAELSSPLTTVKGDGMLTLKGGITMIN